MSAVMLAAVFPAGMAERTRITAEVQAAGDGKKNCRWYKIVIPKTRKVFITAKSLIGYRSEMELYKKGRSKPIATGSTKLMYIGENDKFAKKWRCVIFGEYKKAAYAVFLCRKNIHKTAGGGKRHKYNIRKNCIKHCILLY
ncbi:hypothetical protein AALA00_09330 [Lachnospiraceae bacterium 46-15]